MAWTGLIWCRTGTRTSRVQKCGEIPN